MAETAEPKQGQRSQSARGFCPRSTMRVPQPDIIEHFGNADAVPQPPERCLSRKAGIVRCCRKVHGAEKPCHMPQTSPSSVGNGLDRSEPLPYIPQQNFIPRPLRDVEDAVPYIYFHDSSQIYFAPFPTHRRGQVTPPYRTFAAPPFRRPEGWPPYPPPFPAPIPNF